MCVLKVLGWREFTFFLGGGGGVRGGELGYHKVASIVSSMVSSTLRLCSSSISPKTLGLGFRV